MTKHLTLILFIGLAWGQESIAEKILNEEIEHLENILPEALSDCFKIENRPEPLSCIAKVYGSDEDDEQAMNLVRRLDDVMYKANFDKINSDNKGFTMFYTSIGIRYQNPEGGINVKLGLTPIIASIEGKSSTLNWPHLSLGYSF